MHRKLSLQPENLPATNIGLAFRSVSDMLVSNHSLSYPAVDVTVTSDSHVSAPAWCTL